ncbi:MAG TPA: hypothetical protein VMF11_06560 [Candidatus Baltobacteraceae bacterium]|nr:hypothetical protein [Candidatus Baltobacteraceae bacterium]
MNELARSRVRHRALLDILEERGLVKIADNVERYRLEEERDFKPLVTFVTKSMNQMGLKRMP